MELCPKFSDLNRLCPIEVMLISQIILFLFIIAKTKCPAWTKSTMCFSSNSLEKNSDYFIEAM